MRLYFTIVFGVAIFAACFTLMQILMSSKDNLNVLFGFLIAVCLPVLGFFIGRRIGNELSTAVNKK